MTRLGRGRGRRGRKGPHGLGQGRRNEDEVMSSSCLQQAQVELSSQPPTQPTNDEAQHQQLPLTEPSVDPNSAASSSTIKKVRGCYKSKEVDMLTKNGAKIKINMVADIARPIGREARLLANYCGYVLRTTVSFRDGKWEDIYKKHGETMWTKLKDKFTLSGGRKEVEFYDYIVMALHKCFRTWKSKLRNEYLKYDTDEKRLNYQPKSVSREDWQWLVEHFSSEEFKVQSERNKTNRRKQITKHTCGPRSFAEIEESTRNPNTGKLALPDHVWELQHTRRSKEGEVVWADPQSQEIHGRIHQLVNAQQTEDNEFQMTRDQILVEVLGERSGHVRGKGCGVKPSRKRTLNQIEVDARVSSVIDSVCAEMRAEMEQRRQEHRAEMEQRRQEHRAEMERWMQDEIDRRVNAQLATLMRGLQQGQVQASVSNITDNPTSEGENQGSSRNSFAM